MILSARDGGDQTVGVALEALCRLYWSPVYGFVRSRGHAPHDAEDLTQGFFEDLLRRPFLSRVSPENGRFRSFLFASIDNYLAKERRKAGAQKRGGDQIIFSVDFKEAESRWQGREAEGLDPSTLFDRQWALTLLDGVLQNLEEEYRSRGKQALFLALKGRIAGNPDGDGYREIAGELGMTEGAIKIAAHRIRERYRTLLRQAVLQTIDREDELEEELAYLMGLFARG